MVLPKALAYATIAQLPVAAGLYSALVPMTVYAVLGTSNVLSVSTTTPIAILCASAIGEALSADASLDPLTAAATLSLLVGAMLVAARILRLGFVANFISEPVLTGFKAGVGFVIVVDQLPKLLGIHIHKIGFFRDAASIVAHVPDLSWPTLFVALATLAIIVFFRRFLPKYPAPLLAVAAGIIATAFFGLQAFGVSVVGAINGGLPSLKVPQASLFEAMWPAACGVALISFTELIAAARAFLRSSDAPIDANRELLALGAANVAGAFIGSIPSGGGTSQTAVNRAAGAQTQISSLVVAAAALLTLLFLAPVLALLPQATLGAVVVAYSIALLDPAEMLAIRRVRKMEFHWALAACLGVMTLGTLKGIVIAIVLSLGGLIRLASDLRVDEIVRIPGSHLFRARSARHPDDQSDSRIADRPPRRPRLLRKCGRHRRQIDGHDQDRSASSRSPRLLGDSGIGIYRAKDAGRSGIEVARRRRRTVARRLESRSAETRPPNATGGTARTGAHVPHRGRSSRQFEARDTPKTLEAPRSG